MKNIFVTATNTDIGKTHITLKLLEAFAALGYRVGAFKPIETGVNHIPLDASKLLESCQKLNCNFHSITINDVCPIQLSLPAAPIVASNNNAIDYDIIQQAYAHIKAVSDIVFIEGAGGLMVPVDKHRFMIDLIPMFDAHPLLVTHDRLGSINDTLLSLEALSAKGYEASWCINRRSETKDFETTTLPYYRFKEIPVFLLPKDMREFVESLIAHCHSDRDC